MAAQKRTGEYAVAKSRYSSQCSYLRPDGTQCRSWSIRGEPYCHIHSLSEEGRLEMARAGGRARVRKLALQKALRDLEKNGPPSVPVDSHQEALDRLRDARERLLELYEEGRITANELPDGVLLH
jgi:hypothetical protein